MEEDILKFVQTTSDQPISGATEQLFMGMSIEGLFASVFFGIIGIAYLSYGKKTDQFIMILCGGILILYTYFISQTLYVIIVGTVISVIPWFLKKLRKMGFRV